MNDTGRETASENEPIAWIEKKGKAFGMGAFLTDSLPDGKHYLCKEPSRRKWQGLVPEEIESLWSICEHRRDYAKRIEAKLKERNT
jgi:hypothetical protein